MGAMSDQHRACPRLIETAFRSGLTLLCIAALLLATAGCETPAQCLEPASSAFIKPGTTTMEEVTAVFGKPTETLSAKGRTLMLWHLMYLASRSHTGSFAPSEDSYTRSLSVLFDTDNRVIAKHHSTHAFRTVYGAGSVFAGTQISPQTLAQIKIGITTKSEAIARLGEPTSESLALNGMICLDWFCVKGPAIAGKVPLHTVRLMIDSQEVVRAAREFDKH
jgi:outer membrane protein assembly factor BamE (lipoprotein component of BamABCDE complex)